MDNSQKYEDGEDKQLKSTNFQTSKMKTDHQY